MNNKIKFFSIAALSTIMVACGGELKTLEMLENDKKKLQADLAVVDSLINEKDTTTTKVFNPLVVALPVITDDFSHKIEVLGIVSSDKNIVLSSESNGKIISIRVKAGQKVTKGQTIAIIDGQTLSDNSNELKTQLEYAEYMLEKQVQLNAKGVGSEFQVKQAQNQVNSLKDKMKSLSTMKRKTVVRAPFTGVVEEIMPNTGEFVGAGAPIARIVNVDKVTITAEVSEQLLGNLNEGKDGTVISMKFDHMNTPVVSTIQSIGKFVDPINRTVKIRSDITDNELLLPNMTGKISITDVYIDSATIIPSNCILKDEFNKDYIYILDEEMDNNTFSVQEVYINVMSSFNGRSAVSSELNLVGKKVISAGAKGISKQDIVKLKEVINE